MSRLQSLARARLGHARLTPVAVLLLVSVMILVQVAGFTFTARQQAALIQLRFETREIRIVQQALVDAEDSVKNYVLTGEAAYLQNYFVAIDDLDGRRGTVVRWLDAESAAHRDGPAIDRLKAIWTETIGAARSGDGVEARASVARPVTARLLAMIRADVARFLDRRNLAGADYEQSIATGNNVVLALQLVGGALTLICLGLAFRSSEREADGRQLAINEALAARAQVECLFEMGDMLQSAATHADANAVLRATAGRLLPGLSGALYLFNNSRDRLDLSTHWGGGSCALPDTIAPQTCWALKRGKTQVNEAGEGRLQCEHHDCDLAATVELPMSSRGETYGLLMLSAPHPAGAEMLGEAAELATALADTMSLALANLALRERLRNQALRDPLTGLYNRRYMEDMLDRFALLAKRGGRSLAVAMIDLDHFKRLNDEHGHAMGDTVLRATAGAILGSLRETDVACRYGGEELAVLLPDCNVADARAKGELLRDRIQALGALHGVTVSASIGIAVFPDASVRVADLLGLADAALYRAKQSGRNRVVMSERRDEPQLSEFAIAAE